jgi:N-acetyl-anhydromuramyl-L-alanine amidase AmpD
MPSFKIHDALIPIEDGQAVSAGWPAETRGQPRGVTWHWTATWNLAECRRLIGGADAERQGVASAHYAVGRRFAEGVDRYVSLDDRSWHAGKEQKLRWDGRAFKEAKDKGARTTIGVEMVNIGFARPGVEAGDGWIDAATPAGERLRVQPWPREQLEMAVAVGREILARWGHIAPRAHHGHHDLCPTYKVDVTGFPFARVLSGIYAPEEVPDVWTPLRTVVQRQRVLAFFGVDPGRLDGVWGPRSREALRRFQERQELVADGFWTTFVCWRVHDLLRADLLRAEKKSLAAVAGPADVGLSV